VFFKHSRIIINATHNKNRDEHMCEIEEKLWKEDGLVLIKGQQVAKTFLRKNKLWTFNNEELKVFLIAAVTELVRLRSSEDDDWIVME